MGRTVVHESLTTLPARAELCSVTALPSRVAGHEALRVELTDDITANGVAGTDFVDQPTFVALPMHFSTGSIEIDILSRLNHKTDFDARGFAGIVFGIADDRNRFESVYLRPLNGLKTKIGPPRNQRAVQYIAYPDWPFDRLRDKYPDGRYEAEANIGPDEWNTLGVHITDKIIAATINHQPVLTVDRRAPACEGNLGLFVDIGSEAFFKNLQISQD